MDEMKASGGVELGDGHKARLPPDLGLHTNASGVIRVIRAAPPLLEKSDAQASSPAQASSALGTTSTGTVERCNNLCGTDPSTAPTMGRSPMPPTTITRA